MQAVVITGSRDWSHFSDVAHVLVQQPPGTTVIHGRCPTGADAHAAHWLDTHNNSRLQKLPMPAQWTKHGNRAGMIRNAEMLTVAKALRACGWVVEVHAFPLPQSVGTVDCMRQFFNNKFQIHNHGVPVELEGR